jgi:hypothetical protein
MYLYGGDLRPPKHEVVPARRDERYLETFTTIMHYNRDNQFSDAERNKKIPGKTWLS